MIFRGIAFIARHLSERSISGIVMLNVVDYLHGPNRPLFIT